MKSVVVGLVSIVLLISCSTIQVYKTTGGSNDQGIRFFRPEPYILVAKDEKGAIQSSVIWLPDKSEEYVIRARRGIGALNLKAILTNGWNLTEFGAISDPKIPETITSLSGALQALKAEPGKLVADKVLLEPGLYRLEFANGHVSSVRKVPVRLEE